MDDFYKYSEKYARFWFRFLGFDFHDTEKNRRLTKGEMHNIYTGLADELAGGADLPPRFKLLEREPPRKLVERHGKIYEVESKVV